MFGYREGRGIFFKGVGGTRICIDDKEDAIYVLTISSFDFHSLPRERISKGGKEERKEQFFSRSFRPRREGHLPKTFHFSLRDMAGISVRTVIKYPVKNGATSFEVFIRFEVLYYSFKYSRTRVCTCVFEKCPYR